MSETLELFNNLLQLAVDNGASDVHIKTNKPALLRIDGHLEPIDMDPLGVNQILAFVEDSCPPQFVERWQTDNQIDYSYRLPDIGRFRVNAFNHNRGAGAVFRTIPSKILTLEELGCPPVFRDVSDQPRGIVLVTGPTGSGKSTTLAAMLDYKNESEHGHILTIEDPIEFVHESKKCLVNQREVHRDTLGFGEALRSALREDPDIILVGEMRDLETIRLALTAAETGHLVFGTVHAPTARPIPASFGWTSCRRPKSPQTLPPSTSSPSDWIVVPSSTRSKRPIATEPSW